MLLELLRLALVTLHTQWGYYVQQGDEENANKARARYTAMKQAQIKILHDVDNGIINYDEEIIDAINDAWKSVE